MHREDRFAVARIGEASRKSASFTASDFLKGRERGGDEAGELGKQPQLIADQPD